MANFSINNTEILDTVNYIISGPTSIGQDQQGVGESASVYFTDNVSPYASSTIPSPPPAQNTWIKTDCFATVNIDNPQQKISLGGQLRVFFSYDVTAVPSPTTQAQLRMYVSILRFVGTAAEVVDTNAGEEIVSTISSAFSPITPSTVNDSDLFGNRIIVSYIDVPGEVSTAGIYTYWLMFYLETVSGTWDVKDVSSDVRSLIATKIKS